MSKWKPPQKGMYVVHQPPNVDDHEQDVERRLGQYPVTVPGSFIVSGPLPGGGGPGRFFPSADSALRWALERYGGWAPAGGNGVLSRETDAHPGGRWAIRVRTAASRTRSS